MSEELIARVARALFERNTYAGYNPETMEHRWLMERRRFENDARIAVEIIQAMDPSPPARPEAEGNP